MAATASVYPDSFLGNPVPRLWQPTVHRSVIGDILLVVFLLSQFLDGIFTYVGVMRFGIAIEANPLIATLMVHFGHGAALFSAKLVAALLGIALHLRRVHLAVGVLALFYVLVAIVPWTLILFA